MRKIDKRIIIGICAILAACLLVFIVLPMLIKSQESKVIVVRLIKDVPAHGRITADCIEEAEVKNYNLSAEVIRSADGVVGKYAVQDMYAGMYVVKEQLAEQPAQKNAYLWERSDRVVSINIDGFANGLSGKLEAGDIVSIVVSTENGSEYVKELQYMELLAVTSDTGNDVDTQNRAETDALAAISIGRLSKEKNLQEIIDIMEEIVKLDPMARLLIVGDGPEKTNLEESVKAKKLGSYVKFTGEVDWKHIQNYYAAGDVFTCASTSETQGLTYAEALACGKPILVRKDECLKNLLQDGINGYFYQNETEFIKRYRLLFQNKKYEEMKFIARESVKNISAKVFGGNMEQIYRDCLENVSE